jgi:hypothetical protein
MMSREYYYNKTIKKTVAIFGTLFNDIKIVRPAENGGGSGTVRVPLTYAPIERYLSRINAKGPSDAISIKLPRMSFEITSMNLDTETKLNRMNRTVQQDGDGNNVKIWQAVPYILNFSLSIISRGHDEAMQIVEQILPYFNPTYSVTAKGLEGPDSLTDIPVSLTAVNKDDSYEGDYENSRRTVIYTLDFDVRVKFISSPVNLSGGGLITAVDVSYFDIDSGPNANPLESTRTRAHYEDQTSLDEGFEIEYFGEQFPPIPVIYENRPIP